MKKLISFLTLLFPIMGFSQGTIFTYQGRLFDGGSPANGTNYNMVFYMYGYQIGGNSLGYNSLTNVAVSNGLFTVPLDFGNVFEGDPRWLEVTVRKTGAGGDSSFTTLSPRQQISATPYAILAGSASNLLGNVSATQLPAAVLTNGSSGANLSGTFNGNGNGMTNLSASALPANVAFITANQTFFGTNTFTRPVILSGFAPLLKMVGPGGSGSQDTMDLSTYDPGTNAPSARLQINDQNYGSDWDFYGKRPGAMTNSLVSLLHLSAGGNVGIGTKNPERPLAIQSAPGLVEWLSLVDTNGVTRWHLNNQLGGLNFAQSSVADARLFLSTNGSVGIGTEYPETSLHVVGGILARGGPPGGYGTNNNGYAFRGNNGDDDSGMFSSANGQIEFYNDSYEAMRIAHGNVGIGVTNPTAPLQVNGNIQLGSGGTNYAASSPESLRIVRGLLDPNGKILIGTGFSVHSNSVGDWTISFTNSFSSGPVITSSSIGAQTLLAGQFFTSPTNDYFELQTRNTSGTLVNAYMEFIAIGSP